MAKRWLKFAQAADLLGVKSRTIKRWMNNPTRREALGVVRHGKQWRIPFPVNECIWDEQTRRKLEQAGIGQKPSWEVALNNCAKQNGRYHVEAYRLWLAAYIKALKQGRVTQKVRINILHLWWTACKILALQKSLTLAFDEERLKSLFRDELRKGKFSVKSIMQHWPKENHFRILRKADSKSDFEKIRRNLDFWQAYRDESRRRRGDEPTAENLRRLLHKDLITHINDTREDPPPGFTFVKNPSPDESDMITMASVQNQMQGKPPIPIIIDFRQPQPGISLRTFRTRYPRDDQKPIIALVRKILSGPPSLDDKPDTGKTPVRSSKFSDDQDLNREEF